MLCKIKNESRRFEMDYIENGLAYFSISQYLKYANLRVVFWKVLQRVNDNDIVIYNDNQADVSVSEKFIRVFMDDDRTYDIWNSCKKGVLVSMPSELKKGRIKTNISVETEIGSSSFNGVYIELENGTLLLLGTLGKMNTALHVLDGSQYYEKVIKMELVDESIVYGVDIQKKKIQFYSKDELIYTHEVTEKILQLGVFAKTWEHCKNEVEFQILYE